MSVINVIEKKAQSAFTPWALHLEFSQQWLQILKNNVGIEHVQSFLLPLFPELYNNYLHSIYVELGIINNLGIVLSIQEDVGAILYKELEHHRIWFPWVSTDTERRLYSGFLGGRRGDKWDPGRKEHRHFSKAIQGLACPGGTCRHWDTGKSSDQCGKVSK
jgi:hypothetical protein